MQMQIKYNKRVPKRLPTTWHKQKKNNTVPKNKEGPERQPNNLVDQQIIHHNLLIYIFIHVYDIKINKILLINKYG